MIIAEVKNTTETRMDLMREILHCQESTNCLDCNTCNQIMECQLQKSWEDLR